MITERSIHRALLVLILVSLVIRAFVAGFIEFTNDEVYYWTYAKFPDWSHFDHPPMVGWMIQLFTLNLHLQHEFFIRLGAVVSGTLNTWLIFVIGKQVKNSLTGLYAAFLYTGSLYCSIISGIFIMPDTPQVTFWLISMYLLLNSLPDRELSASSRRNLVLAGVTMGLAMLSKYHSAFLVSGAALYVLFFNRKWFRAKELYIALFLTILFFVPVMIWNYQNDFISFRYHETRIQSTDKLVHWDYFFTELGGQYLYNSPVNGILIILAFLALIKKRHFIEHQRFWLILLISGPLSLVVMGFSLFRPTLPHWTGPAFLGFILITAAWLADTPLKKFLFPWPLKISILFILILTTAAFAQIRYGFADLEKHGIGDLTRMLTGWKDLGGQFKVIANRDIQKGEMAPDAPLFTFRWFPAANLDYYVARPLNKNVYALGTLERIHKYFWIDRERGNLPKGINAYYLVDKADYCDPYEKYGALFDSLRLTDTIRIYRGDVQVREVYVYRLYNLQREISFTHLTDFTEPPDNLVNYFFRSIPSHKSWQDAIIQKAKKENRPVTEVMWEEARYCAEQAMNRKK